MRIIRIPKAQTITTLHFTKNQKLIITGQGGYSVANLDSWSIELSENYFFPYRSVLSEDRTGQEIIFFLCTGPMHRMHPDEATQGAKPFLVDSYPTQVIAFPESHAIVARGWSQTTCVDMTTGKPRPELLASLIPEEVRGDHFSAIFANDSRTRLAYGRPDFAGIHIYDRNEARTIASIRTPIITFNNVIYLPDGDHFLTWASMKIYILSITRKKMIRAFTKSPRAIQDACLTPDGQRLLTCSKSGNVRVHESISGEILKEFDWNIGGLTAIAISPDGTMAAVAGNRGRVVVWDLE
jgi:WD40 repeat protein